MKRLKFNPLDLLCIPRPLNYKFISVRRDISGIIHTYTDFSQQKKSVSELNRRKFKRRFEREVHECWSREQQKYSSTDTLSRTSSSQDNLEQNRKDLIEHKNIGSEQISDKDISSSYNEGTFSVQNDPRFKQEKKQLPKKTVEEIDPFFSEQYFEHFGQPVEFVTWEDDIIYDSEVDLHTEEHKDVIAEGATHQFINTVFNITPWEQSIIYDSVKNFSTTTELWVNDPNLIFSPIIREKKENSYNISLDKYYTSIKKAKDTLGIVHSLIGSKMIWHKQRSFFDRSFKKEMHECIENTNLRINGSVQKSKIGLEKVSNKIDTIESFKVMGLRPAIQTIITLDDHTLTDTNKFVIMEYAEQYPLIKQEKGMGSLLVHYTISDEKNTEGTDHLSEESLFVTVPVTDEPFCVKLRENTSSLVNNLFKARVYTHTSTDFLLIIKNTNFYIRKINNLITVGQTFPGEEVFSPHSRKMNVFCKNRLKQFCFRYANNQKKDKAGFHRTDSLVHSKAIDDYFPLFTDGSKKKWLKEYSEPVRENGSIFYKLKFSIDESDVDNLVTPEQTCLYNSMINYQKNTIGDPPWVITKNYIQFKKKSFSIEVKNDYTGIGEGISFRQGEESEIPYDIWDKEKIGLTRTDIQEMDNIDLIQQEGSKNIGNISDKQKNTMDTENAYSTDFEDQETPYILITRIIDGEKHVEKITNPDVINEYLRIKNREKDSSIEESGQKKKTKSATNISVLRCGACNGVGHMKTNKACPKFISRKKVVKKKAQNLLNSIISQVISKCINLNFSNAFVKPVSVKKFPDYLKIIKRPIDIGMMRSRAKTYSYKRYEHFVEDLTLMWKNCCLYNGDTHGLSVLAGKMIYLANETREEKNNEIGELETLIKEQEEGFMSHTPKKDKKTNVDDSNKILVSQNDDSAMNYQNENNKDLDDDLELDRELHEEFNS